MDSNLQGNSAKIQTLSSEVHDRISSLPDGILSHMLSFLPTKSAAQTEILSKRWKHLWLSVPELDFDLDCKADMTKFTQFMDRLVAVRENSSIRKFRLSCCKNFDPQCLCTWMNAAAMRDVEELELKVYCMEEELKWSHLNFASESMKVMKLHGNILIDIPSILHFPSLKILHLTVKYADELSIRKLLSSCPVLENLQIERWEWDGINNFVISVPSLKWLDVCLGQRMDHVESGEDIYCRLEIDAPNVEYLKLYDVMSDSIIASPMPFVNESWVSVMKILECGGTSDQIRDNGNSVSALFRSISNVRHLTIADFTMEGMRSPWSCHVYIWRPPRNVPRCLLATLKVTVFRKITGVEGEVEMLKYLLENAMVLEQMSISCGEDIFSGRTHDNVREKLSDDLMNCARGSAKCQLVLQIPE